MCDQPIDVQGPFFVKVYLYFVVPPNEPGAFSNEPLSSRAATIWNNLRLAFYEHRIFFEPGFGDCNQMSYEEISSELLPGVAGIDVHLLRDLGYKHVDGIDIYVYKDIVPPSMNGANAFCVPSDHIYLAGSQDGSVLSTSQTVSHEMGHCLGLVHTAGLGPGNCEDDGSNCEQLGDFVCDTPPDNEFYDFNNTLCSPSPLPSSDYLNFMSLFHPHTCRDHFTPGQGRRMRRYLNEEIGVLANVKLQDTHITGLVSWQNPMTIPANIIIEPGGQLDILAPITMHEATYIYVETSTSGQVGGRLNVHNLISSNCGKMWEGILVDGRQNSTQPIQSQGKVAVYTGGIIEHAICGIRGQGRYPSGEWQAFATGGIVTSNGGIFRNNLISIYLPPYAPVCHSSIYFTQFTTTNDFRAGTLPFSRHVFLDGISNIKIYGCSFSDVRTDNYSDPTTRYSGIVANNSRFHIRPLGASASLFMGLYEGVRISEISELGGNYMFGSQFNSCFTGIRSTNNNNYTFDGNIFLFDRPANYTGPLNTTFTGIDMEGGTTAFFVNGNHFSNADAHYDDIFVGTKALSITKDNRSIFSNTYYNLQEGNVANGQNGLKMGENMFSGLMYECNTFEENLNHDNWVKSGIIRKEQGPRGPISEGAPRISSGNMYIGTIFDQQFTNNGTINIEYHHRENTDEELLNGHFSFGTVFKFESQLNILCGIHPDCPNPPCAEAKLALIKIQFFQKKQLWSAKVSAFPTITNQTLRESEAIAINSLRQEMDLAGNIILLHYALDSITLKTDSILTWMGHLQTYNSDLQLAKYHFFQGNYSLSDSLFQNIPLQYPLDTEALTEFNDILALLLGIKPHLQSGGLLNNFPFATLDTLEINWGTTCSAVGAMARDLLFRNGRLLEADCSTSTEKSILSGQTPFDLEQVQSLKIFPNPANNSLTIERSDEKSVMQIQLSDISLGRICQAIQFQSGEKTKTLDVSKHNTGLYLLSYTGPTASGQIKIIITH